MKLFIVTTPRIDGTVFGLAVTQDGAILAETVSETIELARFNLELEISIIGFQEPDIELEFVDNFETHLGILAAFAKMRNAIMGRGRVAGRLAQAIP